MTGWTAASLPDQTGRTAVVTGANSGLGLQTALELARSGAHVVLACRDETRGEAARQRLLSDVPHASTELRLLDLADLASVRKFAVSYAQEHERCDLLVNNAGVMAIPLGRTADGFETQFGTNHLGHFALTGLLLERLLAGPAPRVVTVSSMAHRIGRINFADLNSERGYHQWRAYGQAKLANLLFAFELARRAHAAGSPLVSVAAHPGFAATNLQQVGPRMRGSLLGQQLNRLNNAVFAQSDAAGALPSLYAATMPDVESGEYFGPGGFAETRGAPRRVGSTRAARDEEVARRLWEESERLTGVSYDWPRPTA